MSIRLDIHRTSRIWKVGNDQGVFYGQFNEDKLWKFLGKAVLSNEQVDKDLIKTKLENVIDARFHDELPEIARAIKTRILLIYPTIKDKIDAL